MKKSLVELGKLIKKDIEYEKSFLECVKGSENTQIKESIIKAEARKEAMEAVLTKGFTQNEKETMLTYLRRAKINVDAAFAEKQQKKERSGADG